MKTKRGKGPSVASAAGADESASERSELLARIRMLETELARRGAHAPIAHEKLTTVRVPPPFEAPFLRAQEYVARYFSDRTEQPDTATISIAGERYVLLRAASLSVEFVELVTKLYQDKGPGAARGVADNLLFDFAHALGKADARSFQQKMAVSDPIENLSAGPIHFAFSGWAFVDISPESRPSPDEDYFLLYDHPYSFESHSWLAKRRRSDTPVCVMNAGYSSGWCEESFGLSLVAAEVECLAAGGQHCRFIMAPPSRIEAHLAEYARRHGVAATAATGAGAPAIPEFFQRKRLEDELRAANEKLSQRVRVRTRKLERANEQLRLLGSAVENATEGFVIMEHADETDPLRVTFVNQGFSRITGYGPAELIGQSPRCLRLADESFWDALYASVRRDQAFEAEVTAIRPDGSRYALEIHLMPVHDAARAAHWIAILRDVSDRKAHLEALQHQALHDALTGLPNRVLLHNRLEQCILAMRRSATPFALLFLDLDGFKEINDAFGHYTGDILLAEVGARLRAHARPGDTVARLGGDEFAILLDDIDKKEDASRVVERVFQALATPIRISGQDIFATVSIGIAFSGPEYENAEDLLRDADTAMYQAKTTGKARFQIFDESMHRRAVGLLKLEHSLRRAAEQNEFILHYQPIISLADGSASGFEGLVRWNHPQRGIVSPYEFIHLAEETGLIYRIGAWTLKEACRWLVNDGPGADVTVSVNLSGRQFSQSDLIQQVMDTLSATGLSPKRLKLEITESVIMENPEMAVDLLTRLKALGIHVCIDDFGTGYSSLSYLLRFPADTLKIDRSFVSALGHGGRNEDIVGTIVSLAKSLDMDVVAEGVETAQQAKALQALGCGLGQGYLVSRPVPGDEARSFRKASLAF